MCFKNLIEVEINTGPTGQHIPTSVFRSLKDKCVHVVYDPNELEILGDRSKHDNQLKVMPFRSIKRIRQLGINKTYFVRIPNRKLDGCQLELITIILHKWKFIMITVLYMIFN